MLSLAAATIGLELAAPCPPGGPQRRGVADPRAARDWYLLTAALGVPIAPLLAFTLVSALR